LRIIVSLDFLNALTKVDDFNHAWAVEIVTALNRQRLGPWHDLTIEINAIGKEGN